MHFIVCFIICTNVESFYVFLENWLICRNLYWVTVLLKAIFFFCLILIPRHQIFFCLVHDWWILSCPFIFKSPVEFLKYAVHKFCFRCNLKEIMYFTFPNLPIEFTYIDCITDIFASISPIFFSDFCFNRHLLCHETLNLFCKDSYWASIF